ncbi:MAG TPA: lantibiotic dehydratase [Pyrinomonadaceae bacterium]|nr:lantibiotic dehydratase [Pyrinomonadaceae bacterium]
MPEELIELPGGRWALWRCMGVRGAGFPASDVLKLASPECGAAADRLAAAEDSAMRARAAAHGEIDRALAAIHSSGEWAVSEMRGPLLRARKRVEAGKPPQSQTGDASTDGALEAFRAESEEAEAARRDFLLAYAEAVARTSKEIRDAFDNDRFREAIIWQNRHAFNRIAQSLAQHPPEPGARSRNQRRDEELLASYLQRYCLKNDTIGFFGPVGWARFVGQDEAMITRPGPDLVESRTVFFEFWGIKALADKITADKEVLEWVPPRRMPYVRVEGNTLHLPGTRPLMLTPQLAAVLRECDGRWTAHDLAASLRSNPALGLRSDRDVYEILEVLHARRLIVWEFRLSLVGGKVVGGTEKRLRPLMERIGPERLRAPALKSLDELEEARACVAGAAGDPERLDRALGGLEETFTRLTGLPATRAHGRTYGARTLVFEDCRRGIDVRVGPDVLKTLGPPLSLLLTSARWVSHKTAEIYRGAINEVYEKLARAAGSRMIDATSFWMHVQPLVFGEPRDMPVKALEPLLQERWARVLSLPKGERRVHYTAEALRPLVLETFDAPRPGWMSARQHNPDVMIAADSTEAVNRGDYLWVIGELHIAQNTLGSASFVNQHPAPEELLRTLEENFPDPRIIPVTPSSWDTANVRTCMGLLSPKDWRIEFAPDSVADNDGRAIALADIIVEKVGGELYMRTRDGRVRFSALEGIGEGLSGLTVNAMKILPRREHNPRVTIDRLVVSRESWGFSAGELSFAEVKDEAARFLAARRWAKSHGMPRFVFVKASTEVKPFYLDFDSPIYLDIFAKVVRQAAQQADPDASIAVTEMLPTPDQTWLPDAQGRHYTSELRMVAVDFDHSGGAPRATPLGDAKAG